MAENGSLPSPTSEKYRKATSFPRLFTGLTTLKGFSEPEAPVMSPTSILDVSKPFSVLKNPFWSDANTHFPRSPEPETRLKLNTKGIVDALEDDTSDPRESKPLLFGSKLKIQIPPLPSPQSSPRSPTPTDFGTKTKSPFSSVSSPFPTTKPLTGSENSGLDSPVFTSCLSASEMELSEDYTCVISRGPNPKTTHIFDNCVIESCCGVIGSSAFKKEVNGGFTAKDQTDYPTRNFLSYCYSCKKDLGQGNDIYIFRGEKAFCSKECRREEMILEEGVDKMDSDDLCRISS